MTQAAIRHPNMNLGRKTPTPDHPAVKARPEGYADAGQVLPFPNRYSVSEARCEELRAEWRAIAALQAVASEPAIEHPEPEAPPKPVGRPSSRDEAGENRIALMRSQYATGATLEEIGETFGVTRERIRQLIGDRASDDYGRKKMGVDVTLLMRLVRDRKTSSVDAICATMGHGTESVRDAIKALGVEPAVRRLFHWRARQAVRRANEESGSVRGRMLALLAERPGLTAGEISVALGYERASEMASMLYASIGLGAVIRRQDRVSPSSHPKWRDGTRKVWAYYLPGAV